MLRGSGGNAKRFLPPLPRIVRELLASIAIGFCREQFGGEGRGEHCHGQICEMRLARTFSATT